MIYKIHVETEWKLNNIWKYKMFKRKVVWYICIILIYQDGSCTGAILLVLVGSSMNICIHYKLLTNLWSNK